MVAERMLVSIKDSSPPVLLAANAALMVFPLLSVRKYVSASLFTTNRLRLLTACEKVIVRGFRNVKGVATIELETVA